MCFPTNTLAKSRSRILFPTKPYLLEPLMVMSCAIYSACLGRRLCHSPFKSRAHTLNVIMSALACCSGYGDCWTLCWVSPHSITQTFSVSRHKCITKVDLPKLHQSASLYLGTFALICGLPWHALPWIAVQILCRPLLRTWTSPCLWGP